MRVHHFITLVALAGCTIGQPSTGAGTGGGGGDTGVCHTATTCADCTSCAINGPCASLYSACVQDASCGAVDQCYALCGADAACKEQCLASNPAGASAYTELTQCVNCDQCSKQCAGLCN